MKSKCLNFISVSVGVTAIVVLTLSILGGGLYLLDLIVGELVPHPVSRAIEACFTVIVLCGLVWLSQGAEASTAIGKLCLLGLCTYLVLDWLVSYFRIWPQYAIYVVPLVSFYLVLSLCPSCLDGVYDAMKQKKVE